MSMTMLTVIQIVQALAAYSFVMLFLPWVFLRKYLAHFELSERIIGYFLTGNFYIIYLVFLLQFLHISNSITLWIGTLFPFLVKMCIRDRRGSILTIITSGRQRCIRNFVMQRSGLVQEMLILSLHSQDRIRKIMKIN